MMINDNTPRWFKKLKGLESILHSALLILIAFMVVLQPADAAAHKLRVFAWVSGDTVSVESGLSGGRHLVSCTVMVKNSVNGQTITSGVTDREGFFSFPLPRAIQDNPVDLQIIVATDDGHRAEWLLKRDEYGASHPEKPIKETKSTMKTDSIVEDKTVSISAQEIRAIMDELLDEKLGPIRRQLALSNEEKVSPKDIAGGIGYLIGLAGLAAWLKRGKSKTDENDRS